MSARKLSRAIQSEIVVFFLIAGFSSDGFFWTHEGKGKFLRGKKMHRCYKEAYYSDNIGALRAFPDD
jgi:hypothetical protein